MNLGEKKSMDSDVNKTVYLTIDFEDWSHDFKRLLGINTSDTIREKAIIRSYEVISEFCIKKLNNTKLTFFCTGILAEKFPDIIREISKDGHEIACHYYYHDYIYKEKHDNFEKNINKAKNILQKISNQDIYGFRAPSFSIRSFNKNDMAYFKILSKVFRYDSSFVTDSLKSLNTFISSNNDLIDKDFNIFPVPCYNIFGGLYKIRTGGTSLKFFSTSLMIKALEKARYNNLIPILYMHPYEFMNDQSFYVTYKEMANLSLLKKLYWYIRQTQWHVVGNNRVIPKLEIIFDDYINGGVLKDLLKI